MNVDQCYKYVDDAISGEVIVCRWVKLACERFRRDLKRSDIYFDEDAAQLVLDFFGHLKLWKGRGYKGKKFVLAPHYVFIVSNIFGWKNSDTGLRRFRTVYIEMARKGAKSTFAGGVGAYMFAEDDEPGAECYSAAVKKDQSKIVWDNIKNLLKTSIFAEAIDFYKYNLFIEDSLSKCDPLSSDSKSMDGYDTHFASLDELHAHPTSDVHDLIDDSTGSRSQPIILIITTAGFDQSGVCYQRREYLTKILNNTIQDDTFFGVIYTLDTKRDWTDLLSAQELSGDMSGDVEDDWQDEEVWSKSMPGLCGVTEKGTRHGIDKNGAAIPGYMTRIDDVRKKAQYASEQTAALNNFLTKRMNIWTQQVTRWIDLVLWDQNFTETIYLETEHCQK